MCNKCGKVNCCCNPCDETSMKAIRKEVDNLYQYIETLNNATRFLTKGHPILALEDAADIVLFDPTTGKGSGIWIGWGVCNGNNYPSPTGNIATPNLADRFLTGTGGTYNVGDQGGANTVALTTAEMPTHTHALTDPGHTHGVTDPGHTHTASETTHLHSGQVDVPVTTSVVKAATPASATPGTISIANANTGVTVNSASTGVTIANEGGSTAHENRPPYHAVLFVKKIF